MVSLPAYPPTPRSEFFAGLAAQITHNYGRGRIIVVIDGAHETASFSRDLGVALAGTPGQPTSRSVFHAHADDFLRPRALRERLGSASAEGHNAEGYDAEGYYADRYDYSALLRVLVQPFRLGGSTGFSTANFDAERDVTLESRWVTAPQDAFLLIDGPFLQRPEFRGNAHFTVYLDVPLTDLPPVQAEAQLLYETAVQPRMKADAIVSVTDEAEPRRLFADRC